ncbi:GntR family transcriptional regulator [Companilactobacillus sp. RD055328]|uniref:GntR family transcriptional regulator n=1 Tax=Companilactobacillus sp. RD055328 TaxID=2916634 RepID=UPI001FC8A51B|nr:GntR family transcriptional regulator [Companilactobacillus sp. RD055328]GKQ43262.1 GntR family transcriptional regulator [Companilactobacillus sp. RD055328]
MKEKSETLSQGLIDVLRYKVISKLSPNEKLPSERELVQQYKVSRTTVRNALEELEVLGYVYRQHGRGTFVSYRPQNVTNLANTFSFSERMKEMGIQTKTKILFLKEKAAKEYQAKMLRIEVGAPIYELKRIRYADGEPMIVERTYLNKEIFDDLSLKRIEHRSLYDVFTEDFDIKIFSADETCTATLANADNNKLLDIPVGSPSLRIERLTSDTDSRIVEFTLSIARADKFTYHIRQYYQGNK